MSKIQCKDKKRNVDLEIHDSSRVFPSNRRCRIHPWQTNFSFHPVRRTIGLIRTWKSDARKNRISEGSRLTFRSIASHDETRASARAVLSTLRDRAVKIVAGAGRVSSPTHQLRNLRVYRLCRRSRLTRPINLKDDLFSCQWHGETHVVGVWIVVLRFEIHPFFLLFFYAINVSVCSFVFRIPCFNTLELPKWSK